MEIQFGCYYTLFSLVKTQQSTKGEILMDTRENRSAKINGLSLKYYNLLKMVPRWYKEGSQAVARDVHKYEINFTMLLVFSRT